MDILQNLGQIAFEAYRARVGGKTYDNKPIPDWLDVNDNVRAGWIAAATAVRNEVELQAAAREFRSR